MAVALGTFHHGVNDGTALAGGFDAHAEPGIASVRHKSSSCRQISFTLTASWRRFRLEEMAYFSTEPAPERRNLAGKSRVWDFFRFPNETHPANRRQPFQPRRKIGPTATKTVSDTWFGRRPDWTSG